jgi:DNA replication and repair protein RecF
LFEIDNHPIKKFVPFKDNKTFNRFEVSSIREFLKSKAALNLVILDDIFDKLDEDRVSKIIAMANSDSFGQLFISDTHPERTENANSGQHINPYQILIYIILAFD